VAVVNARVGDATFRRLRRLRRLLGPRFGWLFGGVARFGVQSAADRDRLLALGVPAARVTVTGNLKFESPEPPRLPQLEAAVAALAAGRPVLVAGSTMAGEEEPVLAAFAAAGGGARALLVLAPRHPERWDEAARRLAEAGLPFARRRDLGTPPAASPAGAGPAPAVLLLDSLGELAGLYRVAAGAFVGGTLVPTGGHNPLEPARFGLPVVVGPSMANFRQIAEDFDCARAWERAGDAGELARIWRRWLDDPAAARAVGARAAALVEANRGALDKTVALLREAMPEVVAVPGASGGGGATATSGGAGRNRGGDGAAGAAGEPGAASSAGSAPRPAPGRAAGARP
jgi:3-deoxy-D-manno-octulosonic-acid transferase